MGRGVRARPAPGRRSLGGANCRWTQPLSRPQPPEAVAEGQPLQGLGPSTTIGGRVYASLRLGRSPDLTRGSEGWREAERVRRGAVGYALLVWIFDGLAPDYDVRGREGDHGFGEARIRGELYRGRQDHRATALYSVGLATRTMMHSCASAAKFLGGGTILSLGAKAMAGCGSPPPRIVAPLERIRARRGKKKLLFSKERGKPRSLSSPGDRCSGSRRAEQLDAGRHGPVLDEAPQVDQQLARQRDDHRLAHPARSIGGARLEPFGQRAFLLEHQKPPGQLDHAAPHARIARPRQPLL